MRVMLLVIFVALLCAAALAEPTDPEERIRQLESQLQEQARQIEALQNSLNELKEVIKRPPSETVAPVDTALDPGDPGPEPPPPLDTAGAPPSSSAAGQQPALNPNISVNALMGAKSGGSDLDDAANSFYLEEVEIALQAPIDPNARADIFVAFPRNEAPEIEEATLTWLRMPGGFQAKGGLLLADFGRINPLHTHAFPQIDKPLVNQAFFGEESLRNPGAELSWLLPAPWYSRLSAQGLTRTGGHAEEGHDEEMIEDNLMEEMMAGTYDPEALAEVLTESQEFTLFPEGGSQLMYVGRWENLVDLNEDTTLGLGISGASGRFARDDGLLGAQAVGADLTLKWRPLGEIGRSLTWQSEYIQARQDWVDERRTFDGWYSFLNYQFAPNWSAGVRYGQTELPLDPTLRRERLTFLVEWIPSEWNRLRLQYNNNDSNLGEHFDELMLQWNVVLGPHGAHKY